MISPVAAADVASVWSSLSDEVQRGGVFTKYPRNAKRGDLFFKRLDGKLEFSLLHGHGHQFVWKRRPLTIGGQRVEERETIFAARNTHRNAVAGPQHGEPAHDPADKIQNFLLDVHDDQ